MSDAEVITACENVCRDFSTTVSFLNDLSPMIALAGAILLFFLQRRADRLAVQSAERARLYSKFLASCETIYLLNHQPWGREDEQRLAEVYSQLSQIELVGSITVSENCRAVTEALLELSKQNQEHLEYKADEYSAQPIQNYFSALRQLVDLMKRDVLS